MMECGNPPTYVYSRGADPLLMTMGRPCIHDLRRAVYPPQPKYLSTSQPGGWTKLGGVQHWTPRAWSTMRKGVVLHVLCYNPLWVVCCPQNTMTSLPSMMVRYKRLAVLSVFTERHMSTILVVVVGYRQTDGLVRLGMVLDNPTSV